MPTPINDPKLLQAIDTLYQAFIEKVRKLNAAGKVHAPGNELSIQINNELLDLNRTVFSLEIVDGELFLQVNAALDSETDDVEQILSAGDFIFESNLENTLPIDIVRMIAALETNGVLTFEDACEGVDDGCDLPPPVKR